MGPGYAYTLLLLRLPVPCLHKEHRFVDASLDSSRQPPLRAETPAKRFEFGPHLRHRELNIVAHALRRASVPIRDRNVAPPAPRSRKDWGTPRAPRCWFVPLAAARVHY